MYRYFPPFFFSFWSTNWSSGHLGKRSTSLTASSYARAKQAGTRATVTAEGHWSSGWGPVEKIHTSYFFCPPRTEMVATASPAWSVGELAVEKGHWAVKNWKCKMLPTNVQNIHTNQTFHVLSYRNRPGVYTRISEYRTWIRNVLRSGWVFQRIKVPNSETEQLFWSWQMHELYSRSCWKDWYSVIYSRMW